MKDCIKWQLNCNYKEIYTVLGLQFLVLGLVEVLVPHTVHTSSQVQFMDVTAATWLWIGGAYDLGFSIAMLSMSYFHVKGRWCPWEWVVPFLLHFPWHVWCYMSCYMLASGKLLVGVHDTAIAMIALKLTTVVVYFLLWCWNVERAEQLPLPTTL
jgi:hypothetical protein